MKKIKYLFLHNWKEKLISLLLATVLVLFLNRESFKEDVFPRSFILETHNIPSNLRMVSELPQITLRLRASREIWSYINPTDISVFLDLKDASSGIGTFPVKYRLFNREIAVLDISPKLVEIVMEEVTVRRLPFQVAVVGEPAEGFVVSGIEYDQQEVMIAGVSSTLKKVEKILAHVNVNQARNTLKQTVQLLAYDIDDTIVNGVELSPSSATIIVEIVVKSMTKSVLVKPVLSQQASDVLRDKQLILDTSSVTIKGPEKIVTVLKYVETTTITEENIRQGTFVKSLIVPEQVTLSKEDQTVSFVVQ